MLNTLAFSALCACFAFVLVALLADWEATRQMVHSRFRFVPLVRLCRSARGGAALMVGLFMGVSLAATPLFALMAILLAALVTLAGQGGLLAVGAIWQAGLRGFLPVALMLCFVANVAMGVLPQSQQTLSLGLREGLLASISAIGFWFIAELRFQQDLLRLRD